MFMGGLVTFVCMNECNVPKTNTDLSPLVLSSHKGCSGTDLMEQCHPRPRGGDRKRSAAVGPHGVRRSTGQYRNSLHQVNHCVDSHKSDA